MAPESAKKKAFYDAMFESPHANWKRNFRPVLDMKKELRLDVSSDLPPKREPAALKDDKKAMKRDTVENKESSPQDLEAGNKTKLGGLDDDLLGMGRIWFKGFFQ
ncbi:hypothetical protein ACHAPT_011314 [Fusarium lateritium]